LIRRYLSDASIWKKWKGLLKKDNIQFSPITFKQSDDKCGSADERSKELASQIADLKVQIGTNKVKIVGHNRRRVRCQSLF
jgi:hypothetical protein